MVAIGTITQVATIISGVVSLSIIFGVVLDAVTSGWVRGLARRWLGVRALREDHVDTQTFLMDLADSYNDLSDRFSEEHDIPEAKRPAEVDTDYYERRLDDDAVQRGDFLTDDDD